MEPSVQELLIENAEAHNEQPLTHTRNWLAQNAGLFKESIRRVKKKALTGVRSIRTYFQPSNNGELTCWKGYDGCYPFPRGSGCPCYIIDHCAGLWCMHAKQIRLRICE